MKQTKSYNPAIPAEIRAMLDHMVASTDKWIHDNNKALERERKQDEKNREEINEALKKLTH